MAKQIIKYVFLIGILSCAFSGFHQWNQLKKQADIKEIRAVLSQKLKELEKDPLQASLWFVLDANDSLIAWNNTQINPPKTEKNKELYVNNKNIYLCALSEQNDQKVISLTPISTTPAINNHYFTVQNPDWLPINHQYHLGFSTSKPHQKPSIKDLVLIPKKDVVLPNGILYKFLLSAFFLYLFLTIYWRKGAGIIGLVLTLILYFIGVHNPLSSSELCNPSVLAFSGIYQSLWAFITVNCFIALCLQLVQKNIQKIKHASASFISLLFFHFTTFLLGYLIISLIEHSTIPFDFTKPLTLNAYSLLGFLGLTPIVFVLHLFLLTLPRHKHWISIISCSIVLVGFGHYLGRKDLILLLFPLGVILLTRLFFAKNKPKAFWISIFFVVGISVLSSHLFIKHQQSNILKEQKKLAEKMSSSQDPVLEFLLNSWQTNKTTFSTCSDITKHLNKLTSSESYFSKYDMVNDSIAIDSLFTPGLSQAYSFKHGNIYQLYTPSQNGFGLHTIFKTKLLPSHLGFPELLLEGETKFVNKLKRYQFAQYHGGKLTRQFGNGDFLNKINPLQTPEILKHKDRITVSKGSNENFVLIQSKLPQLSDKLSVFSLFALLFCILLLSPYWLSSQAMNSISNKLRNSIILTVAASLLAFAIASWQFISHQQNQKNEAILTEKANSVLTELSHKLTNYETLTPSMEDFLANYLVKFSNVFFTDITLYNTSGKLLATSRKELFSKQLRNTLMHPEAYQALHKNASSLFVHTEQIGNLHYLSAYIPFKNANNEVLAYLNLPYFAKQSELDSELSGFLTAMLNMFMLLLSASIVISLLLANSLTKPLRWLQESLSTLDLSKNQPLNYQGNNELSELINVYNQKVKDLEQKAIQLAETERNSAWREMAKQVAHEIKNPLTPMKLQIQYLQHTSNQNKINQEQINKTAKAIIEQIDALARIADEFSAYSTMPKKQKEDLNVGELIHNIMETYQNNQVVNKVSLPQKPVIIQQDRTQLVRVLNNIIKNAYQAFDPNQNGGEIHTTLEEFETHISIAITDNAGGIPIAHQKHIFEPKFTTKSSGTGLGLPMCKTIITGMGGSIQFESKTNQGTTFTITIPK